MGNEIIEKVENELIFSPEHITKETIKKYLCPNASDQELLLGLQIAKTFKLNPLKREIYFVKYGNNPMQVLTGYEVYLKRAARSGLYMGMKSWTEGSPDDGSLKGLVEVYVKGWEKPLQHEADYSEYVQKRADGQINKFWREKPKTMIKKVAISQAFRLAFPDEFDGMPYTRDEVIDVEAVESKPVAQVVEMPKLRADTVKNIAQLHQGDPGHVETKELAKAEPEQETHLKGHLSEDSIKKLEKAKKFIGSKMSYICAKFGLIEGQEVPDDETANKIYSAAYQLYKADKK